MVHGRQNAVSVALACLLFLAGSSSLQPAAAQEPVELLVWDNFTGPETTAVDAIYAGITEQHPNITIQREVIQTEQMRQTVNTAISSGTGPDIIFYDSGPGYAGVLADAGLISPLDAMADEYGWRDSIAEQSLEATTIDGQIYGLPLQIDLIGMFYNKTLMDQEGLEIPQTVEELKSVCEQAREKGYIPLGFTNNPGFQAYWQFSMITGNMIGPDALQQLLFSNEGSWDSPEIVSAIDAFFVELREAGCYDSDVNALTTDDGVALFQSGQALMYPAGSWTIQDFSPEAMPDMEIQMMPFPELEGGQGSYFASGVGSAYYISAASEHQEEAGIFLDYLFSPEVAEQWVAEANFLVPMSVDTTDMDISPLFKSVLEHLDAATSGEIQLGYNIDVLAPPEFNQTMQNGFQLMIAGDKSAEDQAADLQAAWEESWIGTPTP